MFHLVEFLSLFSIPSVVASYHITYLQSYHQTTSLRSVEGRKATAREEQIDILASHSRRVSAVFSICKSVQLFKCGGLSCEEEMFSRASWEFFWFAFNCCSFDVKRLVSLLSNRSIRQDIVSVVIARSQNSFSGWTVEGIEFNWRVTMQSSSLCGTRNKLLMAQLSGFPHPEMETELFALSTSNFNAEKSLLINPNCF